MHFFINIFYPKPLLLFSAFILLSACGGGSGESPTARSPSSARSCLLVSAAYSSSSSVMSLSSLESSSSVSAISSSFSDSSSLPLQTSSSSETSNISSSSIASNQAPIADAGTDQSTTEGELVTLTGTNSQDNDGTITSFLWNQTQGANASLSATDSATTTFTAPNVSSTENLIFTLTVTDNVGAQNTDSVKIFVLPAITKYSVTVSWNAPSKRENGNNLPIAELGTFYVKYTNTSSSTVITETTNSANSSLQIDDIPEGSYSFQVAVQDTEGLVSEYSDAVIIELN